MWVIPASVRCVQTAALRDRQAGRLASAATRVSRYNTHTPRARIPPRPHTRTKGAQSASRTTGSSNAKNSNTDKKIGRAHV